tara:strand:- start:348 stop:566 length:219 start_codon:yes stop_codon:yes gene_type:complete
MVNPSLTVLSLSTDPILIAERTYHLFPVEAKMPAFSAYSEARNLPIRHHLPKRSPRHFESLGALACRQYAAH